MRTTSTGSMPRTRKSYFPSWERRTLPLSSSSWWSWWNLKKSKSTRLRKTRPVTTRRMRGKMTVRGRRVSRGMMGWSRAWKILLGEEKRGRLSISSRHIRKESRWGRSGMERWFRLWLKFGMSWMEIEWSIRCWWKSLGRRKFMWIIRIWSCRDLLCSW